MEKNNFALLSNDFGFIILSYSWNEIVYFSFFPLSFRFSHSLLALFISRSSVVSFSLRVRGTLLLRARYCVSHDQKLSAMRARPKKELCAAWNCWWWCCCCCLIRRSRRLRQAALCQLAHSMCGKSDAMLRTFFPTREYEILFYAGVNWINHSHRHNTIGCGNRLRPAQN